MPSLKKRARRELVLSAKGAKTVWAMGDLHLSFGVPDKGMEVFGNQWEAWTDKIASSWRSRVGPEDLILIPGDISWAMRTEGARVDLEWIDALPGQKILLRGNHDYWWTSKAKVKEILPPSIQIVQHDVIDWNGVSVGGSRLWDTPEFSFSNVIEVQDRGEKTSLLSSSAQDEKIYQRELTRLEMSLKQLDPNAQVRIAMTHYPPIGANLATSRAARLLERYRVDHVVFGHLHSLEKSFVFPTGTGSVRYHLVSCDYLNFQMALICRV